MRTRGLKDPAEVMWCIKCKCHTRVRPISWEIHTRRDTDGSFVVSDDVYNVYGVGKTQEEAIEDYESGYEEFIEILKKVDEAHVSDEEE